MNDPHLVEIAKASLVPPGEFGERNFSGPDEIGETHMLSISKNRDSSALDISNFNVVSEDMLTRFPDDCSILNSSHWAVGWVDQLVVRVLETDYKPSMPADWKFTDAFLAIVEWSDSLADYPVANEADFSRIEFEEFVEFVGNESYDSSEEINGTTVYFETGYGPNALPDDHAEQIAQWLCDNRSVRSADETDTDDIKLAARKLGFARADVDLLTDEIRIANTTLDRAREIAEDIERGIADMSDLHRILKEDD